MNARIDGQVEEIKAKFSLKLPAIDAARELTRARLEELQNILTPYAEDDAQVVVYGSLARGEWTEQSDLDWTLLIDGQAKPEHRETAHKIESDLAESVYFKHPSSAGAFGNLTFSHNLIHQIGGQHDTNANTTQRVLMLLESVAIGDSVAAHYRTRRAILDRYLSDDTGYHSPESNHHIPRFLLNDVVRFWRTMCVDFACKRSEQDGKKWGIRNIKLRMSRKLIYTAGLLACGRLHLLDTSSEQKEPSQRVRVFDECFKQSPLEIVAEYVHLFSDEKTAQKIFGAYDQFLAFFGDEDNRVVLEELKPKNAYGNAVYDAARDFSHEFQEGLTDLLIKSRSDELREYTIAYGVF